MRRANDLWPSILSRDNLRQAVAKALRGKRDRPDARQFCLNLEANLSRISEELASGRVVLGRFRQFVIFDPKERLITAPCFEERVVHHALMNVCEPVFERRLIADTFACRRGKGREAAVERAFHFARRSTHFLKMDIRKYFDSIPHAALLRHVERMIKDKRVLDLIHKIVTSYRGELGLGLPIGSLTSQHFANSYLAPFDRFVKETIRRTGYVRYMDDMAIWGDESAELNSILAQSREFLATRLGLTVKSSPFINRTLHGMDFLGGRVFASHVALSRRSKTRFRRSMRNLEAAYRAGEIDSRSLQQRATALCAFARAARASSWRFRGAVLKKLAEQGPGLEPVQPGRQHQEHACELPLGES